MPSTSDAPPETREVGTQVQPERQIISDTSMERYDGYCLMAVPNLEAFIRLSTSHSARCGFELELINRDTRIGAYMVETWKCPVCQEELHLKSCEWVRTEEVAQGASHSWKQPDVNIRMVKAAHFAGKELVTLPKLTRRSRASYL